MLDHPVLAEYTTEPYVKGMEYVIRHYEPNIVLFGASSIGRDMAPRIAGRIHTRFMSRVAPDAGLLLRYDVYPMGELPLPPKR